MTSRSAPLAFVAAALIVALVPSSGTGKPATAPGLVRIVSPSDGQVIRSGHVRLVISTTRGARPRAADIDGVTVTRLLRAGAKGTYSATLSLGHGLRYGFNDAFVLTTATDRRGSFDETHFVLARRDDRRVRLTTLRVGAADTPVRATIRLVRGSSFRAYVNNHRVNGAFRHQGRLLVGRLGANDGLRFGRNRILLMVYKTGSRTHRGTVDVLSRTISISRRRPLAGAGFDKTVTEGNFTRLNARSSMLAGGSAGRSFRWKISSAPKGSHARLRNASSATPSLIPDAPGYYVLRVTVHGRGEPAQGGIDTVTLTVLPDIPPIGLRLETMSRDRGILLDGSPIANTECCHGNINYAVIDRKTLVPAASGSVQASIAGVQSLSGIVDNYTAKQDYLVVINWVDFQDPNGSARDDFDRLLQKIGVNKLTTWQREELRAEQAPGSAVGVAGAPAGSAFVTFAYRRPTDAECPSGPCDAFRTIGGMSGALRLNGVTGKYDFGFTDFVDFDTGVDQTQAQISPSQLTIKVGDRSYTGPNPGGSGGFHLLRLNAKTLEPYADFFYRTNAEDGAEQTDQVQRLANDLNFSADQGDRPLVVLQAYGTPHGNDAAWDNAAKAIARLGGTRQVFNAMNPADPRAENGEDANRKGPYAFVGRVGESAPRAEASYSLNGLPGRLRGVLMRARDGGFEPMLAGPPSPDGQNSVNTELIRIVNQPAEAFPAFKDTHGNPIGAAAAQAVQNFLGGPQVTGLCSAAVTNCDIRKTYYQNYRSTWPSIQNDLSDAEGHKCPGTHEGFTADQCEGIREQLRDEVSKVAKVTHYLGPEGLQEPFGAASVSALADIGQISQEIKDAVKPPLADNTTSHTLAGISYFLKLGLFAPPPASQVAAGTAAVFGLAGYFTNSAGAPDVIGARITTSASNLGVELASRYQQAGDNLDDVGQLIVSDWGKLRTVASRVDARPGPGEIDWRLGSVGQTREALRRVAKQMIYERLVPLAYPMLYDLGESGNARGWYCYGGSFTYDKNLFGDQPDSGQFIGRFPADHWSPTIAVAQTRTVGSLHSARVPGIPASIADPLFKDYQNGGLGLTKLEFYSPANGFRYFPAEPTRNPGYNSATGEWDSLNQFPRGRPDVITCFSVPNPPGNSG